METTRELDRHRQVLAAARDVLAVLGEALHSAYNSELAELATEVDALAAAAGGARGEVVLEAVRRGVVIDSGFTTRRWVIEYCPSLRQGGAGQVAKIVDTVASRTAVTAGADYDDPESYVFDRSCPAAIIWRAVRSGEAGAPMALTVLSEVDRIADRVVPEAVASVAEGMLVMGIACGPTGVRDVKTSVLATFGRPDRDEVEKDQNRLRKHASLSAPQVESGDLTRYQLALTPEQSARLEAAIGPLARPRPNEETGERDLRSNGQRRAEALIELVTAAVSADAERMGGPAESDACIQVTITLDDLQQHKGAGEVLHSRADGTLLGVETLRKMCCDADLIPVVLGTSGQVLDVGMTKRLFTRAQRRTLWRRDRSCTYPGCDSPPVWTRAHHVTHWADGGPTDLSNAALLCQRHHTFVHERRLWADVRQSPDELGRYVIWDTTPGSYDQAVASARDHNAA